MTYRLVIVDRAERDVAHIFKWLAKSSSQGATAWYNAYIGAIQQIVRLPEHSGIVAESARLRVEVREKLFKTRSGLKYRIIFELQEDLIRILRIRGPGQPPLKCRDLK